jgi:UDP-galactopyranose mutase
MDIICFSHLRWNFVYQRPQHLMSRFAKIFRVFFIEEPIYDANSIWVESSQSDEKVWVIVPHLTPGLTEEETNAQQQILLRNLFHEHQIGEYIAWYYTPMALILQEALPTASLTVYDCMDELSAFKNAPLALQQRESALMARADIVFTGGHNLYEAKKTLHHNIHPFPSSIDKEHFSKARGRQPQPPDQESIVSPRLGFFGVLDERLDIELLDEVAQLRPQWNIILIGPVVKIDPALLPQRKNIHYLGAKTYAQLPEYLSGWDIALIPFAKNESTRFISPTKTPEYLAGGKPVVSTSIQDVVDPYGEKGLVYIADTAEEFIKGVEWGMDNINNASWLKAVDHFLADISWEKTWEKMLYHVNKALEANQKNYVNKKTDQYV